MINKKLLSFDRGALRYVGANVAFQWLGMLCNVIFVRAIAQLVGAAFAGSLTSAQLWQNLVLCLATVPMRFAFTMLASAMSDQASKDVKRTLRSSIYAKLARLGPNYTETAATSEVVMLASEGVEQIDTYFAKYLPQLFYSLLAPLHPGLAVAPDWRLGLLLGLGGMAGMYLGARCQKHVPATALKYLLAGILLFTAARYLGQAL